MSEDFDREAVLAKVAERRRRNEELIAERRLLDPDVIAAQCGESEARRRARVAERRGQLDLSGREVSGS